ncbi:MAG TPA: TlpA family protein disulfide reductase [Geobacter sp.]|nr:TlpA family protein disulfide reductase [Geobacter sp.]
MLALLVPNRRSPLPYRTLRVALLLAFVSLLPGCEENRGVKIGEKAPSISGNDVQGNYISLPQMKGKTVVIYFWTDSCCGDNLKQLEPFFSRNRDRGLEIVAVNEMDPKEKILSLVSKNGLSFTMLSDEHSMLFKQYNVLGFPTILILDRDGVIREKVLGEMPTAKLEKLIERHLDTR